jgi:multidrug efflux pump subunit AcrA (membrane-fusion protein)
VTVRAAANPALHKVARILGRAPTTDPLLQGDGYLALLTDDPPRPGAVLSMTVLQDATPQTGVAVPPAAVVWVNGASAVYVEPAAGEFERRTVTLGPRTNERWLVTAGLAAGERLVVTGAAQLLSSEVLAPEPVPAAD